MSRKNQSDPVVISTRSVIDKQVSSSYAVPLNCSPTAEVPIMQSVTHTNASVPTVSGSMRVTIFSPIVTKPAKVTTGFAPTPKK